MNTNRRMVHLMEKKKKKWCRERRRKASAPEVWDAFREGCGAWGLTSPELEPSSCDGGGQSPCHHPPALVVTSYIYRW